MKVQEVLRGGWWGKIGWKLGEMTKKMKLSERENLERME